MDMKRVSHSPTPNIIIWLIKITCLTYISQMNYYVETFFKLVLFKNVLLILKYN